MAFIGHPLVCDAKYSALKYEADCAIVPRIFLHSLRMEFEDTDGQPFVAASDLAPDLQVALSRIQELAAAGVGNREMLPSAVGFPGLARLLEISADSSVKIPVAPDGASEAFV